MQNFKSQNTFTISSNSAAYVGRLNCRLRGYISDVWVRGNVRLTYYSNSTRNKSSHSSHSKLHSFHPSYHAFSSNPVQSPALRVPSPWLPVLQSHSSSAQVWPALIQVWIPQHQRHTIYVPIRLHFRGDGGWRRILLRRRDGTSSCRRCRRC